MIHRSRSALALFGILFVSACGGDPRPEHMPGDGSSANPSRDDIAADGAALASDGPSGFTSAAQSADDGGRGGGGEGGVDVRSADAGVRAAGLPVRADAGSFDPGVAGDGDLTLNSFTTQPDLTDRGAPKGKSFRFTMDSTKSVIFDGTDKTLQAAKPRSLTRQIDVYIPAQYKDGTPAPILVIQDGPGPLDAISRALDNLTIASDAARKLPAFIAIAVQNGGNDAQGSERGLEYDTLSDRYARFVELEVLPAVRANTQIKAAYPKLSFTTDPEGRAAYGCSSGAAAAFTMAWFRPDLFRRVISYSGTFVAQQDNGQPEAALYPLGAWEYHSSKALIVNGAAPKPLRVFLNVNSTDNGYNAAESGHHNWVLANQRMAAALKAKNYHYRFVLAEGLGHCDAKAWQATLADTLVWTWAGYRP